MTSGRNIFLNGNTSASGLEISGHAGLGRPGNDILCAAVSVLGENLGTSIKNLLGKKPLIEEGDGSYSIHLADGEVDSRTELLFSSAILGLQNLSVQYPDRIQILSEMSEA